MKIVPGHDSQKLLLRPIRITQAEPLTAIPSAYRPLAPGAMVYVSPFHRFEPFAAPKTFGAVANAGVNASIPKKGVTLEDFTKNVGIGAGLAAVPLGVMPLAKHATQTQIAAQFTNYGFTPDASGRMASSALGFARSNLGHLCCVFFAGSAITIGTVEALKPEWPWKRKLITGAIGGAILVAIALVLILLGVWGSSAAHDQKVAPAPTKAESKPVSP